MNACYTQTNKHLLWIQTNFYSSLYANEEIVNNNRDLLKNFLLSYLQANSDNEMIFPKSDILNSVLEEVENLIKSSTSDLKKRKFLMNLYYHALRLLGDLI